MKESPSSQSFPLLCSLATMKDALIPKGIQPKEAEAGALGVWEGFCGPLRERAILSFKTRQMGNRMMMFLLTTASRGTWQKQTIIIAIF